MPTKPIITSVSSLPPITIHTYERYLPTAFDESLTILQKMNKLINHLNEIGEVSNNLVKQWNELMIWITDNGLEDIISDEIDKRIADGTFDTLIYKIVGDLNLLETIDQTDMVKALNEVNKMAKDNAVDIGDISLLNTNDKDNLVLAINEILLQVNINKNAPTSIGESTGHGTISGLKVTQQPVLSMAVDVGNNTDTNIVHMPNGVRYTPTSISLPVKPSHATLGRKDIVFVNELGVISYLDGVPSSTPVPPDIPIGSVLLAEIYVQTKDTTINDVDITDKRDLKSLSQLLTNNKSNLVQAINEIILSLNDSINNAIGDVANLPTTDKTSLVNAIIEIVQESATKLEVGDLSTLPTNDQSNLVNAIIEVIQESATKLDLGDKNNLTTSDKNTIVQAINEVLNNLGSITTLNTVDKTNVVKALNELLNKLNDLHNDVGDLSTLTTIEKSNLVKAINEINQSLGVSIGDAIDDINLELAKKNNKGEIVVNLLDMGCIGDGVVDDTIAFQNAIKFAESNGATLYHPTNNAIFRITSPLYVNGGLTLNLSGSMIKKTTNTLGVGSNKQRGGVVTNNYNVDAIIIVKHLDNDFSKFIHFDDVVLVGHTTPNTFGVFGGYIAHSSFENMVFANVQFGMRGYCWYLISKLNTLSQTYGNYVISIVDDGSGVGSSTSINGNFIYGVECGTLQLYGLAYSTFNIVMSDRPSVVPFTFAYCNSIIVNTPSTEYTKKGQFIYVEGGDITLNSPRAYGSIGGSIGEYTLINIDINAKVTINGGVFSDYTIVAGGGTNFNTLIRNGASLTLNDVKLPSNGNAYTGMTTANELLQINNRTEKRYQRVNGNMYLTALEGITKIAYSDAVPTGGAWNSGDRIYNNNPNADSFLGWVCVLSGSPGTWKGFGKIEV